MNVRKILKTFNAYLVSICIYLFLFVFSLELIKPIVAASCFCLCSADHLSCIPEQAERHSHLFNRPDYLGSFFSPNTYMPSAYTPRPSSAFTTHINGVTNSSHQAIYGVLLTEHEALFLRQNKRGLIKKKLFSLCLLF